MFGRLLGWYTVYAFSGALALDGISPSAKFTLRSSLEFATLAALLHGTAAAGLAKLCGVV